MHIARFITSHVAWSLRLASLITMSACVIPVGPQFDDPEQNYPPYIATSDPGVGEIFTPGQDEAATTPRFIVVTAGDHNLEDNLHVRWLLDYPSPESDIGQLLMVVTLPFSGKVERTPFKFLPTCPTRRPGMHRLVLSISDRPFLDQGAGDTTVSADAPLDSVKPEANRMRAVWVLNCP
jgi:hypothetical protein